MVVCWAVLGSSAESTRPSYLHVVRATQTARLHAEALAHKAQQAQASLQRALEESMTRLQSEGGNMIDRRIINKLLVSGPASTCKCVCSSC